MKTVYTIEQILEVVVVNNDDTIQEAIRMANGNEQHMLALQMLYAANGNDKWFAYMVKDALMSDDDR